MKFQNLFLFLLLFSAPLSHCMEEKGKPASDSIDEITTAIESINLNSQPLPTNDLKLSQKEIQHIVSILALREKVTKLLYQRCSMNLSVRIDAKNIQAELATSKKAVLLAFEEAEIAYSLASNKVKTIINMLEKDLLKKSNNTTASYTALKVGLNLWVLADETNDTYKWFEKSTDVFCRHKVFFDDYLSKDALCYKDSLSEQYQKYCQKLTTKSQETPPSIYSLDTCIYKASKELKLRLFHFLLMIHTLVLKDLVRNKILTFKNAKPDIEKSAHQIRLQNKRYQKKINLLNTPQTKTIQQTINDFLKSNYANNIKDDLSNLINLDRINDTTPAYYKYLDYLKAIFSSFSISKIITPHTDAKIEKIVNDNQYMNDLIAEVLNQLQKKPKQISEAKKLPEPSKKRKKRRKKAKKQTLNQKCPINLSENQSTPLSNAQKRRRRRRKQKAAHTTQANIKDEKKQIAKTQLALRDQPAALIDKNLFINAKEDILHINNKKYICILDLIREQFNGYQNKIFIPKSSSPLPYNPLKDIVYSKYASVKMNHENDNNHAFSSLVSQFGQHGYIKDQVLTNIQKKALGTKHHIQNSTQYRLQHTVYLPARITSLGYPVKQFEQQGCTASGKFEFTFVRKDQDDPGICIHRFFRPYH